MNNYFDLVVVINLKSRTDRMRSFMANLPKDWPFAHPIRFEAVEPSSIPAPRWWLFSQGAWGCLCSHYSIIRNAVETEKKRILIMEDDAQFADGFSDKVRQLVKEVPEWDALYLGGQHRKESQEHSPGVVRCIETIRTHCYAMQGDYIKYMERFLRNYGHAGHVDQVMSLPHPTHSVYAPDPFLVGQRDGGSDITSEQEGVRFWNEKSPGFETRVSTTDVESSGLSSMPTSK